MIRLISILLIAFPVWFVASCNGPGKDVDSVDPDAIYFDYKMSGEEGDSSITILLQYRFAGPYGRTVLLDSPAKIMVDGKLLTADSSKYTGAYYECMIPADKANGRHTIVYTDTRNREYKEEVEFRLIALANPVPDTLGREDWIIELQGLDKEDYVRVVLTDTSRYYDGINELDTVVNGRMLISREQLETLAEGNVFLELIRETERPVRSATPEGGTVSVWYALRREFYLKN